MLIKLIKKIFSLKFEIIELKIQIANLTLNKKNLNFFISLNLKIFIECYSRLRFAKIFSVLLQNTLCL